MPERAVMVKHFWRVSMTQSEQQPNDRPVLCLERASNLVNGQLQIARAVIPQQNRTDENAKLIIEGFDYRKWENLDVPPEIKDLYQYIAR